MKKNILFCCCLFSILIARAQVEVAMDWTKTDCAAGTTTTLFDVLNDNIVVVQEYVMMSCSPCITAGNVLVDILADYETMYPGKVVGFQTSFDNTITCDEMNDWAGTNSFNTTTQFNMGADEIDYYGTMGMPTLLIFGGGIEHRVFYYHLGSISSASAQEDFTAALDEALAANGVVISNAINNVKPAIEIKIYPNPAMNELNITSDNIINLQIEITDITGKILQSVNGKEKFILDISTYAQGLYFINIVDNMSSISSANFIKL